jgi:hypothetical protein
MEGGDPVKDAIDKGKGSATFVGLLKSAGVTDHNYSKQISVGDETATAESGHITLKTGLPLDESVMGLTQELTNKTNLSTLNGLSDQVASGKISTDDYAKGIVNTEAKGFVNKVLVASELGLKDLKSSGVNSLVDALATGKITKEQLTTIVVNSFSNATVTGDDGKPVKALDNYKAQGAALRAAEVEKEKKNN